ncbi:MAG: AMP-binding protein [Clostridia bacterium]|nr:AMP-binding protein [Clostridia bacterium]
MNTKPELVQKLESKYMKTYEITDLKDMLLKATDKFSNKPAFKVKDENGKIQKISYKQFLEDVKAVGTAMIKAGLKDKKIAVVGKNSYKWSVAYMASTIVGVVVPLDKELHIDDIINFINISESEAIFGDDKYLKELQKNIDKLNNKKVLLVNMGKAKNSMDNMMQTGKELIDNNDEEFMKITINPDEMKILLFTSGTTGSSKAVMLSHKNICENIRSVAGIVKVSPKTKVLSILPIHHTYECTLGFLLVIYSGGCIAHCEGLRYILQNMKEYKPTLILCVPLLLDNMYKKIMKTLKSSLPAKYFRKDKNIIDALPVFMRGIVKNKIKKTFGGKLYTFIVGAAAMNPEVSYSIEKFGMRVLQGYGLTECSPLVAGNNDFYNKDDSAGLPIPNVEFKINNPNDEGVGEIIVKGPNVMLGYYKNEAATKEALRDGWFYTGDLGKIDENGYLYITGRSKSVIVTTNGKNIYPEELEYYLNEEDTIAEAIVLGVEDKKKHDTIVKAKIFPDMEAIKKMLNVEPTKEQIRKIINDAIQKINSKIPNYKHIKDFKIVDEELEKTTTKKIKRYGKNTKIDE